MEIKHLKQYCMMRCPVYLLIADIKNSNVHWVLLQQFANSMQGQSWRQKTSGTVTIHVPKDHVLTDHIRMEEEVVRGYGYLANHYIADGIKYEEEFYNNLDEKFKVSINVSRDAKHVNIIPIEDVTVHYTIDPSKLKEGELGRVDGKGSVAVWV